MIIGISGLAGSGKDTCADFFVRKHGLVKVSLGDPLKRICRDVYGFSVDQLWGPSERRNAPDERYPRPHGPFEDGECLCCGLNTGRGTLGEAMALEKNNPCYLTPRFALQQLGTEWGRTCYPNTWIDYALNVAKVLSDGCHVYDPTSHCNTIYKIDRSAPSHVVIPDIRFKNELDALRAAGAKLIRIVRRDAGLAGGVGQHRSETEQASIADELFDHVILNNRGLAELEEAVTFLFLDWSETGGS